MRRRHVASAAVPRLVSSKYPARWTREPERKPPRRYDGDRFFTVTRKDGKEIRAATPLFLCLVAVELSDVVFAVDSIPAVLGISTDPLVVYSSNIFAIMGLRALWRGRAASKWARDASVRSAQVRRREQSNAEDFEETSSVAAAAASWRFGGGESPPRPRRSDAAEISERTPQAVRR